MQTYLEEIIGNPDLFTGRKQELKKYLQWIENIADRNSRSMAILSRRKTGKTALMQRMYNILFHENGAVIPFYYEIREEKRWAIRFCKDFFLQFIFQYIAFKSRKAEYLRHPLPKDLSAVIDIVQKEGLDYLKDFIDQAAYLVKEENTTEMWDYVRDLPRGLASLRNEFFVQMIDEFQFLNSKIYRDEAMQNPIDDFAAGYFHTAEYKNAPLLVSGSWVGWLMDDLIMMLPARFTLTELENIPEEEAVEMAFKYAHIRGVPITEETAYMIADIGEGNPFYISAFFDSQCPDKDLTTKEGLIRVLEFETLNDGGIIKSAWMEYVKTAWTRINGRAARRIVLYLCHHRDRQVTRKELRENLALDMDDQELETKLDSLVKSDIIEQGASNFRYQGVQDNIFDKVFRGVYAEEIESFDSGDVSEDYRRMFRASEKKYRKLLGKTSQMKGAFAEYLIIRQLRFHAHRDNDRFRGMTENLPPDFRFVEYQTVWTYRYSPIEKRDFQIDVFARAPKGAYSIIGEVKNRSNRKFNKTEAAAFLEKMAELMSKEGIEKAVGFIFSVKGFTKDTTAFMKTHGVAWSSDGRWLDA